MKTAAEIAADIVCARLTDVEYITVIEKMDEEGIDADEKTFADAVYAEIKSIRDGLFA